MEKKFQNIYKTDVPSFLKDADGRLPIYMSCYSKKGEHWAEGYVTLCSYNLHGHPIVLRIKTWSTMVYFDQEINKGLKAGKEAYEAIMAFCNNNGFHVKDGIFNIPSESPVGAIGVIEVTKKSEQ